jgi:hypothetical protein
LDLLVLSEHADGTPEDLGAAYDAGLLLEGIEQLEVLLGEPNGRLVGLGATFHCWLCVSFVCHGSGAPTINAGVDPFSGRDGLR